MDELQLTICKYNSTRKCNLLSPIHEGIYLYAFNLKTTNYKYSILYGDVRE